MLLVYLYLPPNGLRPAPRSGREPVGAKRPHALCGVPAAGENQLTKRETAKVQNNLPKTRTQHLRRTAFGAVQVSAQRPVLSLSKGPAGPTPVQFAGVHVAYAAKRQSCKGFVGRSFSPSLHCLSRTARFFSGRNKVTTTTNAKALATTFKMRNSVV